MVEESLLFSALPGRRQSLTVRVGDCFSIVSLRKKVHGCLDQFLVFDSSGILLVVCCWSCNYGKESLVSSLLLHGTYVG